MQKILITGGAGFIGSELARRILSLKKYSVVVVDNLSTGALLNIESLPTENFEFVQCDVNLYGEIEKVMKKHRFDYVFHFAAMVGVQRTQANPHKVLLDLHGIENVLTLSKETGVKRVFYSSSSEVYGEPVSIPQNEFTTPLNSRVPYAIVKNVGESFLRTFKKEYNLDYTIFRFFNTYGSRQSKDFVVPLFLSLALTNKDILINGDGHQTRTFCYIDDSVSACVHALEGNELINDVVNIGDDREVSVLELAKIIIRLSESKSKIKHNPPLKEGDMTRRLPDISRMRKILKVNPISIEEGIKKMLKNKYVL